MKITLLLVCAVAAAARCAAATPESSFLTENHAAMSRMMAAMTVKPAGDVDADFVDMMEPHHQGAIDMAVLELRYGQNERLRRIAQEIVVEQGQEIVAMRSALGRPLSSVRQNTDGTPSPNGRAGEELPTSMNMPTPQPRVRSK